MKLSFVMHTMIKMKTLTNYDGLNAPVERQSRHMSFRAFFELFEYILGYIMSNAKAHKTSQGNSTDSCS